MQLPALRIKTSACMAAALFLFGPASVLADVFDEDPIEVLSPPMPSDPPVIHTAQDGPSEDPLLEHTAQDDVDPGGDPDEESKNKKQRDNSHDPFSTRSDAVDPVRPMGVDGALDPMDLVIPAAAPDARDLIIDTGGDVFSPSLQGDFDDALAGRGVSVTEAVHSSVPSPGALIALGMGALLQRRRRRR